MTPPIEVLVVDDEASQREVVAEILSDAGHRVRTAASGPDALVLLEAHAPDLLLTDLRMPGMDGVALMREALGRRPELVVILSTAYATVASAVEAMKSGAHDYLQKPYSKDELLQRVSRVAERVALLRENERLRRERIDRESPEIVGESEVMTRLLHTVDRIARVAGDVLITGESGTGKELVARRIHYASERSTGPFVAVNTAAIPENLAESELFGHEKGAFTHAVTAHAGRFEQAHGGTLFLDEVSSMPMPLQAKLLRVLGDRTVERVGGTRPRTVDVRVVSATNVDLRDRVREGTFREDLYHRLNVLEVHLPPLRERGDDLPLLAGRFRDRAALRYQVPPPPITDELLALLRRYAFPGNVRELEHLVEKMVVLSEGDPLTPDDLPPSFDVGAIDRARSASGGEPVTDPAGALRSGSHISLAEVERGLLEEAIRLSDGNLAEAAKRLGLSYKTMRYRAHKFGLAPGQDSA